MKCLFALLLLSTFASAVETSTILARQKEAAFPDTSEVRMRATVAIPNLPAQSVETSVLSKGKDKSITEIKSSAIAMRIVRNADKISVTDLKTGVSMPSQSMGDLGGIPDIAESLGKPEDYNAAVKVDSLWKLTPKDQSKPVMYYSEKAKRIVKMVQTIEGIESETIITYCNNSCKLPGTPSKIEVSAFQNGIAVKTTIEILSATRIPTPPDAMFDTGK
jgi:hypothetical protein